MAQTSLKHATDDLLGLLAKSEHALDAVARKLDDEFAMRYKSSGTNPMLLSKRIKKLSMEIPSLKAECQALIQRKQDLIDAAKQHLLSNRSQLQALTSKCGLQAKEDTTLRDFTDAMADWESSLSQGQGLHEQQEYLSRDELNQALAGSMLARQ